MNQLKSKNWIFIPRNFEELYSTCSQQQEFLQENDDAGDIGMRISDDIAQKVEDVYVNGCDKGKPVDSIHCCSFYDN